MNCRDQLRSDLMKSMAQIFSGAANPLLLDALKAFFPCLSFALVVNWVPEQSEDIYWILIDLNRIAVVEIPRFNGDFSGLSVDLLDVVEYRGRRHSAEVRRKLEVAIELMRENRSS
ncbi:hypothetical protein [Pseudomonas asplenii]|uniref:hypothetical protein n=1 Tax=Pseudomonas asplenii TaxID=53407 RepID=UPI0022341F96|nr:hypothetical protein [Pseudomonas asplenii]UZE31255.1 hypothetical protein LOY63_11205 [Pseudomonas asplenii]